MKPLDSFSDQDLRRSLAAGEFTEKEAVIAAEILRRHRQAKAEELKRKYGWLGGAAATLVLALMGFKRLWTK